MRKMRWEQYKWIDDAVKAAFGTSKEQLEAEYEKAAALQTPDTVRPEPEGEFERILARAEEQTAGKSLDGDGTATAGEDPSARTEQEKGKMQGGVKPFLRKWCTAGALASLRCKKGTSNVLLVFLVIFAVALWPGMKAAADRKIHDEWDIRVLEPGYIPEGRGHANGEAYDR